jgi:hypothetical protein
MSIGIMIGLLVGTVAFFRALLWGQHTRWP